MTLRLAGENETPTTRIATLTRWQRQEVEAARKLLCDVETIDGAQLAGPLGAYWAGRLAGALANVLDVIDASVTP
jgi:hypothetical protein